MKASRKAQNPGAYPRKQQRWTHTHTHTNTHTHTHTTRTTHTHTRMHSATCTHTHPPSHFLSLILCAAHSACMGSAVTGLWESVGPLVHSAFVLRCSHRPDLCANDSKSGLCYSLCAPVSQMNTHNLELTAKVRVLRGELY